MNEGLKLGVVGSSEGMNVGRYDGLVEGLTVGALEGLKLGK
jgi:hypothetical protein